jgi:hypothetical protein
VSPVKYELGFFISQKTAFFIALIGLSHSPVCVFLFLYSLIDNNFTKMLNQGYAIVVARYNLTSERVFARSARGIEQLSSTWGTRRHLAGYVTFKRKYINS